MKTELSFPAWMNERARTNYRARLASRRKKVTEYEEKFSRLADQAAGMPEGLAKKRIEKLVADTKAHAAEEARVVCLLEKGPSGKIDAISVDQGIHETLLLAASTRKRVRYFRVRLSTWAYYEWKTRAKRKTWLPQAAGAVTIKEDPSLAEEVIEIDGGKETKTFILRARLPQSGFYDSDALIKTYFTLRDTQGPKNALKALHEISGREEAASEEKPFEGEPRAAKFKPLPRRENGALF